VKEGKRRREKGKERMKREMPLLHRCNNSAAIFTAFVRIQGALADAPLQRHDGACVSGIGSKFSPRHNEPFYRGGAGRKEREKKKKSFPSSTVASEGSFEIMTRQWRCCELARSKRRQASATRNEKPPYEKLVVHREKERKRRDRMENDCHPLRVVWTRIRVTRYYYS